MRESLGQIVLNGKPGLLKAKRSCDFAARLVNPRAMAKGPGASAFKEEFTARVCWARTSRGNSQDQMAKMLGIPQDKYKHYEVRSFMPHELVPRFCLICSVDEKWLFTGKGKAPVTAQPPRVAPKRRAKPRRSKAA